MKFDLWERQQLEKAISGSIKATKAQMKQFQTPDKGDQLRSAKSRLQKYVKLLDKLQKLN